VDTEAEAKEEEDTEAEAKVASAGTEKAVELTEQEVKAVVDIEEEEKVEEEELEEEELEETKKAHMILILTLLPNKRSQEIKMKNLTISQDQDQLTTETRRLMTEREVMHTDGVLKKKLKIKSNSRI